MGAGKKYTELDVYKRLIGRRDVWSRQNRRPDEKGKYGYLKQDTELTDDLLMKSLSGNGLTVGVYTVVPEANMVVNPTIDVDNHDGKSDVFGDVKVIFRSLKDAGLFPYIEASAGELKDGAHIGVMCQPADAFIAKTMIERAIAVTGLEHEVNPKQDKVEAGKFGNLVKLPFQYNNRTNARSKIINPETLEPFTREDAIAHMMSVPDTFFPDVIPPINQEDKEEEELYQAEQKHKTPVGVPVGDITGRSFQDVFKVKVLPCIESCYNDKWELHDKPGAHEFRLASAGHLMVQGCTDELVSIYFKIQKDFSQDKTNKQIASVREYLKTSGKPPMGCRRIQKMCIALLNGMCGACPDNVVFNLEDKVGAERGSLRGSYFSEKGRFIVSNLGLDIMQIRDFVTMSDNLEEMYVYENGVYKRIEAEIVVRQLVTDLLGDRVSKHYIAETIYYIQTLTAVPRNRVNSDVTKINLKNGLFNLMTEKLEVHTPAFLSTQQIPVNYVPGAECPEIANFLLQILPIEDVALILQLFGYVLIPNRDIQKAIMMTGSGANGKGTLARLMVRYLGRENCSTVSLKNLNEDRFAVANLYGKLANICPDLPARAVEEDSVFKALTGKDTLHGERKFETGFDFDPCARLIFSANTLPYHPKGGYAWNRRWIIINFNRKFEGKADDKKLDGKIQTDAELSGLLNLALYALKWLLQTWEYHYFKTPDQVGDEYELKSNPLAVFLKECTVQSDDYTSTISLYEVYVQWAKMKNVTTVISHNLFGRYLKNTAGLIPWRPFENGKYLPHGYQGICLNDEMLNILTKYKEDVVNRVQAEFNRVQAEFNRVQESNPVNLRGYPVNEKSYNENLTGLTGLNATIINLSQETPDSNIRNEKLEYPLRKLEYPMGYIDLINYMASNPVNPVNIKKNVDSQENLLEKPAEKTTKNPVEKPTEKPQIKIIAEKAEQWQKLRRTVGNSSNLTDAVFWICNELKMSTDTVYPIVKKLFKIPPHTSHLCQTGVHKECGGHDCECFCHSPLLPIKILKDLPAFVAADGITYTLKAGDECNLPTLNALALISKNGAIKLEGER